MAPRSREVQEKLSGLESSGASIDDQLTTAAEFINARLNKVSSLEQRSKIERIEPSNGSFHAKEEWVLRWLLRKWQSKEGAAARKSSLAWRLFLHILCAMPLASVAHILNDRKFISILRQTLIDAKQYTSATSQEIPTTTMTSSKKRKRDSNTGTRDSHPAQSLDLILAILDAALWISRTSQHASGFDMETEGEYAQFYMNAAIRTSAEEASTILGIWLSLCKSVLRAKNLPQPELWLTPFIHIWSSHMSSPTDMAIFSMNCVPEILGLLVDIEKLTSCDSGRYDDLAARAWKPQLEQLLAQRVLLPAKTTFTAGASDVFKGIITSLNIPQNPYFAPVLFDIAIRSLPLRDRQRRPVDETKWLQEVFGSIESALPEKSKTSDVLNQLLQNATTHQLTVELSALQSIMVEHMKSAQLNWKLIGSVLNLDPNTFLIPQEALNLLEILFERISATATDSEWMQDSSLVDAVLVPLMMEFANARDLPGFLHHWFAQLSKCDELRGDNVQFSAWEVEQLQDKLPALVKETLTIQQLRTIVDWLEKDVSQAPGPALVLLDALAGSLSSEDAIDSLGPRIIRIVLSQEKLPSALRDRYTWRKWRIIAKIVNISEAATIDEFKSDMISHIGKRLDKKKLHFNTLETFEAFKLHCALCELYSEDTLQQIDVIAKLENFFATMEPPLNDAGVLSVTNPADNVLLSFYLTYFMTQPELFRIFDAPNLIRSIWAHISSSKIESPSKLQDKWYAMLRDEATINNSALVDQLVTTIMKSVTESDETIDPLAASSLASLPLEVFSRSQRDAILKAWSSKLAVAKSAEIITAGLSLVVRLMQRPILYEGMSYKNLVSIAKAISANKETTITVDLFAEFSELCLKHAASVSDQTRGRAYIEVAIPVIKKQTKEDPSSFTPSSMTLLRIATSNLVRLTRPVIDESEVKKLTKSSKKLFLAEAARMLELLVKSKEIDSLRLHCCLEALLAFKISIEESDSLHALAEQLDLSNMGYDISEIIRNFFSKRSGIDSLTKPSEINVSSIESRVHLHDTVSSIAKTFGADDKGRFVAQILEQHGKELSSTLLIAYFIEAFEDSEDYNLATVYANLCEQLASTKGTRQFYLTAEVLETLIRTHHRAITQFNVDATLSAIALVASQSGPSLKPSRAGSIFVHLCRLMNAILINHYLKLQGRFHLVVQAMQALLRCLFIPLPFGTRALKTFPPPPWLASLPHQQQYQLSSIHAAVFVRLVTLICDPTVSSVTRSYNNALTSATDKAKRTAGLHMPFVLSYYIKLQLEMDMKPEVREKLTPALYAMFDTTTLESRKVLGDTLDASGRAVLMNLTRDYLRFGKWKGN